VFESLTGTATAMFNGAMLLAIAEQEGTSTPTMFFCGILEHKLFGHV
jgi:hypothetical protein